MARPKATAPKRKATLGRLADVQRHKLLHGGYWAWMDDERDVPPVPRGEETEWSGFDSLADMKRAWRKHRSALLKEQAERFPGSKPFAWWYFERSGHCIDGEPPDVRDQPGILVAMGELTPETLELEKQGAEVARLRGKG